MEPWTPDTHSRWATDSTHTVLLERSANLPDGQLLNWGHQGSERASERSKVTQLVSGTSLSLLNSRLHIPSLEFPNFHLHPDHLGSFSNVDSDSGAWGSTSLASSQVTHMQRPLWVWRVKPLYYIVPSYKWIGNNGERSTANSKPNISRLRRWCLLTSCNSGRAHPSIKSMLGAAEAQ